MNLQLLSIAFFLGFRSLVLFLSSLGESLRVISLGCLFFECWPFFLWHFCLRWSPVFDYLVFKHRHFLLWHFYLLASLTFGCLLFEHQSSPMAFLFAMIIDLWLPSLWAPNLLQLSPSIFFIVMSSKLVILAETSIYHACFWVYLWSSFQNSCWHLQYHLEFERKY